MKQTSFLPKISLKHGGDERKGLRKIARPFDPKRPLHVTMRSSKAHGRYSMLISPERIEAIVQEAAQRRHVRIYRYANVGNHLHFLLQARKRPDFQAFLREIAGRIATLVTGAHKGEPRGKFWDALAWSRVVSWGREFKGLHRYLMKNLFEAAGLFRKGDRVITLEFDPPPD